MDHDTALRSANQALEGRPPRSSSSFASVELRAVAGLNSTGHAPPSPNTMPRGNRFEVPNGAWELAALFSVGLVTLVGVVTLWFL